AGVSGVMLLAIPARTASFFSWPLSPPELAAIIGASYLVAAAAYGAALRSGGPAGQWRAGRVMLCGIVALSVPILVVTLGDLAIFDFGRWQALAWVILFALFPVAALGALGRGRGAPRSGHEPRGPATVLLGGYAAVALAGAAVLW